MNSFTPEETERMDEYAAEMQRAGHNGTVDYFNGGFRCFASCRVCEEEAGTLCSHCGAASFEEHTHDCPENPDNHPDNCPGFDGSCTRCKHNGDCGRQDFYPEYCTKSG